MTNEDMLTLNIDGKEVEAKPGELLIQVADREGIYIPRFCYHEKLSISASCRMCLVDVERMGKPAPACATPVSDGMVVHTRSEKAKAAQRSVMEFLLINHPLDCPICDQGGECELQDFSLQYGAKYSLYEEEKRHYEEINIGPLVQTYMNRCIQCTRCVRYGEEIAGLRELGGVNRGDRLEITTYVEQALSSEVSANIIDICPVGALTAKPSKYQARPWEYKSYPSISIHDGLGTNTYIHTYRNEIARVVSRRNDAINETWIADRDRFSYEAIVHDERALEPLIDDGSGKLIATDWGDALTATRLVVEGAIEKYGADEVGVIASPSATVEELYLLARICQKLGIEAVDHRYNQRDFSGESQEPSYRSLGLPLDEVAQLDSAFLVGANLRLEAPVLGIHLRQATRKGAKVSLLNSFIQDPNFEMNVRALVASYQWVTELGGILATLAQEKGQVVEQVLSNIVEGITPSQESRAIAAQLLSGEQQWVLLGRDAINHPEFNLIRSLAMEIARVSGAAFGYLSEGANSVAAELLHKSFKQRGGASLFEQPKRLYLTVGALDYQEDFAEKPALIEAIEKAEAVIALTPFITKGLLEKATIILPVAAWGETSGTLINLEGRTQAVQGAAEPKGVARPLWKVLRVLGNQFSVEGFDYVSSQDVYQAAAPHLSVEEQSNFVSLTAPLERRFKEEEGIIAIPYQRFYGSDAYLRRSPALQATELAEAKSLFVNEEVSVEAKSLAVIPSAEVAKDTLLVPVGLTDRVEYYEIYKGAE